MFWFILIALSERWRELEMRRRSLLANVTRFIQCYHASVLYRSRLTGVRSARYLCRWRRHFTNAPILDNAASSGKGCLVARWFLYIVISSSLMRHVDPQYATQY